MARVNFDSVLEIENTKDILEYTFLNSHTTYWGVVRLAVLKYCHASLVGRQHIYRDSGANRLQRYTLFLKTLPNYLQSWPQRDIWNLARTPGAYFKSFQGQLYEPINEPLCLVCKDKSLYLDASYGPDCITAKGYALRRVQPAGFIAGKMARYMKINNFDSEVLDFLNWIRKRVRDVLDISLPERLCKEMYESLRFVNGYSRFYGNYFRKKLEKSPPKLIILGLGHYGGLGFLVSLAKEFGVRVAEMQHAVVFPEHEAYNYAYAMQHSSKLKRELPDYMLTYGSYWNDNFRIPGKCITIGNPWFSMRQKELPQSGRVILFTISANFDFFKEVIERVASSFTGVRLIVRPHPAYKAMFKNSGILSIKSVELDESNDIYDSLNQASIVVSDFSTTMIEAAASGRRVFYRFSPDFFTATGFPLESFKNAEELVCKLQNINSGVVSEATQNSFFAKDWRSNFLDFLENECNIALT